MHAVINKLNNNNIIRYVIKNFNMNISTHQFIGKEMWHGLSLEHVWYDSKGCGHTWLRNKGL